MNMAGSQKRHFSKISKTWSDDIALDKIENEGFNCQKKQKNSIVQSDKTEKEQKLDLLKNLIEILKQLLPNVFKEDTLSVVIITKLIEDLLQIENLIKENEDYENNVDYIIQAQKVGNQLKYNTTINSGKLLDNIGPTAVEKYFNQCTKSYYEENFSEIELLGTGGFGKVFKATHKIDKVQYAIKKIKIKSHKKKEIQQSLNEVKTLAKLHHPNVIAYKNAWIELKPLNENEFRSSQSSEESSQSITDLSSMNGINTDMQVCKLSSSQEHISENESSQDSLNFETGQIFTLYIQMALCPMNLRTWMDNRSEISDELIIRNIAKQILLGLHYIHQLKIVHHDINPKNILINLKKSNEIEVRIGDFGLARCLLKKNCSEIGGTPLYCAPEQLENKRDPKSDIFSFGIVLFELLYPMKTDNERCKEIKSFQKGNDLPIDIISNYNTYCVKMLKQSIVENPKRRASAQDLLNMITNNKIKKLSNKEDLEYNSVSNSRKPLTECQGQKRKLLDRYLDQ